MTVEGVTKRRRRLLDLVVVVLIPLTLVTSTWWTNHTVQHAVQHSGCLSSNEFRRFMSSYLHSQVGVPPEASPGFDQLDPASQKLILALAPALNAGRSKREAYASRFDTDFPVRDCP